METSYTPLPIVRNFVQEFLQQQDPSTLLRQAVVDGISGGYVNIRLGGSSIIIPNVRKLASYVAAVGDTVWVAQTGPDLLVIGKIATDNLPDSSIQVGYETNITTETIVPTTDTVFVTMDVPLKADRKYKLLGHARYRTSTEVERRVRMQILADGTPIAANTVNVRAISTGEAETILVSRLSWIPGLTATWTIAMTYARVGGSSDALHRASSAFPSELAIEDIGPV